MANGINGASCYLKDVPSHTIPTPRPRVWMHDTDAHPLTNMAAEMPTNVNIRSSGDTLFTFKRNFCYQNRPPVACPSGSMSPPTPTPRTAVWFDRFIKQEKYKNRLPSYIPSHNLQSSRSPRTPRRYIWVMCILNSSPTDHDRTNVARSAPDANSPSSPSRRASDANKQCDLSEPGAPPPFRIITNLDARQVASSRSRGARERFIKCAETTRVWHSSTTM